MQNEQLEAEPEAAEGHRRRADERFVARGTTRAACWSGLAYALSMERVCVAFKADKKSEGEAKPEPE